MEKSEALEEQMQKWKDETLGGGKDGQCCEKLQKLLNEVRKARSMPSNQQNAPSVPQPTRQIKPMRAVRRPQNVTDLSVPLPPAQLLRADFDPAVDRPKNVKELALRLETIKSHLPIGDPICTYM